ncbi:hypothetical protein AX16_006192 [Volvariella volvacea WC 439]|nr:hypothetical protein AX16_006192 [Volvariella volvacea WC 439]
MQAFPITTMNAHLVEAEVSWNGHVLTTLRALMNALFGAPLPVVVNNIVGGSGNAIYCESATTPRPCSHLQRLGEWGEDWGGTRWMESKRAHMEQHTDATSGSHPYCGTSLPPSSRTPRRPVSTSPSSYAPGHSPWFPQIRVETPAPLEPPQNTYYRGQSGRSYKNTRAWENLVG